MKTLLLFFVCFFVLFVNADWESDLVAIKNIQNEDRTWKRDYVEGVLNGMSHVLLTGYDYNLTAGGDYTANDWTNNYYSFWPEFRGSSYPYYEDNTEMYRELMINLGGLPANAGSYPLRVTSADHFLKLGSYSDLVNNTVSVMDNDENGFGISDLSDTETVEKVMQVTDAVVDEFHDAISNVQDYLFVLDFSSIGQFYVNVCSTLGIIVSNPFSDFRYMVSLIPDEVDNPYLFKLYTYHLQYGWGGYG